MSDNVVIALIATIPSIITAVMSGINHRKITRIQNTTNQVQKQTNGMVDKLVTEAKINARNEVQKEMGVIT